MKDCTYTGFINELNDIFNEWRIKEIISPIENESSMKTDVNNDCKLCIDGFIINQHKKHDDDPFFISIKCINKLSEIFNKYDIAELSCSMGVEGCIRPMDDRIYIKNFNFKSKNIMS